MKRLAALLLVLSAGCTVDEVRFYCRENLHAEFCTHPPSDYPFTPTESRER